MKNQFKYIILFINLFIFGGTFYVMSGWWFQGETGWISTIKDKAIEGGEYDIKMNEYNTVNTFSSDNNDNNKEYLFSTFKRSLTKDGEAHVDGVYMNFIDSLLYKWDIKRENVEAKDISVKSKHEFLYETFILEFNCNFEQFSNLMTDLEGYEKLFKIKTLKMDNPIIKNKGEVTDIKITLEIDALTMNPKNSTTSSNKKLAMPK